MTVVCAEDVMCFLGKCIKGKTICILCTFSCLPASLQLLIAMDACAIEFLNTGNVYSNYTIIFLAICWYCQLGVHLLYNSIQNIYLHKGRDTKFRKPNYTHVQDFFWTRIWKIPVPVPMYGRFMVTDVVTTAQSNTTEHLSVRHNHISG